MLPALQACTNSLKKKKYYQSSINSAVTISLQMVTAWSFQILHFLSGKNTLFRSLLAFIKHA